MIVSKLIKKLQEFPPDMQVMVKEDEDDFYMFVDQVKRGKFVKDEEDNITEDVCLVTAMYIEEGKT